jgi:hypothetical protein
MTAGVSAAMKMMIQIAVFILSSPGLIVVRQARGRARARAKDDAEKVAASRKAYLGG